MNSQPTDYPRHMRQQAPARDNLACAACVCASILGLLMGVGIGFIVGAGTCF